LRERCHLKLDLPRPGCHSDEPATIVSGGCLAAGVERVVTGNSSHSGTSRSRQPAQIASACAISSSTLNPLTLTV
jgi:hypothetical protein